MDNIKRVIALKSSGGGAVYFIGSGFGALLLVVGIIGERAESILLGALMAGLCAFFAIKFLTVPKELITLTEDDTLILPRGVRLPVSEIRDVSYEPAVSRGMRHKWGRIIIFTDSGEHAIDFVEECETVGKELLDLMYEAKYGKDASGTD